MPGRLFIKRGILLIFGLRNKNMRQIMVFQQLEQPVKIVGLVSFNAKSFHHM